MKSARALLPGRVIEDADGPVRILRVLEPSWPTFAALAARTRRDADAEARRHLGIYTRAIRRGLSVYRSRWGNPALIHAHMALPAGAAALAAAAGSTPVLLTEHTTPSTAYTRTAWQRGVCGETYRRAAALLAVSPWLANEVSREFGGVNPVVVPNVVRDDIFTLRTPAETLDTQTPEFLSVSSLIPGKGIECLIAAAHRLVQSRSGDWRVTILGSGPLLTALERLAANGPAHSRIAFVPSPDRAGLAALMQRCIALIMPSELETFGLVACEANACGTPVIAAASGGARFTQTPETGMLFQIGDTEALASHMRDLLDSKWRVPPDEVRASIQHRFGCAAFLEAIGRVYEPFVAGRAGTGSSSEGGIAGL